MRATHTNLEAVDAGDCGQLPLANLKETYQSVASRLAYSFDKLSKTIDQLTIEEQEAWTVAIDQAASWIDWAIEQDGVS